MKINPQVAQIIQSSSQPKQPPAQAARALIDQRPELGDQSFGELVSNIARGDTAPPKGNS